VPKPGMFDMPVRGEVRVLDALEKAGLFTPQNGDPAAGGRYQELISDPGRAADLEHARLTRGETTVSLDLTALLRGDASQNQVLQSGDMLTVPRRPVTTAYAMGEVRNPGRISLPRGATVLDLLNAAGGTTTSARPSQGRIVRTVNNAPVSIPVNVGDLLGKGDQKQNLALQDGDVLFIPPRQNDTEAWRTVVAVLPFLRGW
jgi:protein involved in polysaccharide export with SLBB domain